MRALRAELGLLSAVAFAVVASPTRAFAAEAAASTPPSTPPAWAASVEALGLPGGRVMLGLERRLGDDYALVLHPFGLGSRSSGAPGIAAGLYHGSYTTSSVETRALGLDAQLRRYVGPRRSARWFVAPGLEAQYFTTKATSTFHEALTPDDRGYATTTSRPVNSAWTYLGLSFDVGFQVVLSRLVLGSSVGIHARAVLGPADFSEVLDDHPLGWKISHGEGVRPRARLWLGFTFD